MKRVMRNILPTGIRSRLRKAYKRIRPFLFPEQYGTAYVRSGTLIHEPYARTWREGTTFFVAVDTEQEGFSMRNGHLFDPPRRLVYEDKVVIPARNIRLERTRHIRGTVAYLSNTAVGNYYHWLCLTLPLLSVYKGKLGVDPDFYYVGPSSLRPWHFESLQGAGVDKDRILTEGVTADRIIAVIPNRGGPVDTSFLEFTRGLFVDVPTKPDAPRRLFVGRGETKKRPFVNEEECTSLLEGEFGFSCVTMDGRTIEEQASLFKSAELIVAPHGAALANLLFAKPDVTLLEMMPFALQHAAYREIASFIGCRYVQLKGLPVASSQGPKDLIVNVDGLRSSLSTLLRTVETRALPSSD
jgi:hypothetical protein